MWWGSFIGSEENVVDFLGIVGLDDRLAEFLMLEGLGHPGEQLDVNFMLALWGGNQDEDADGFGVEAFVVGDPVAANADGDGRAGQPGHTDMRNGDAVADTGAHEFLAIPDGIEKLLNIERF